MAEVLSVEQIRGKQRPIYVKVFVDGREYLGQVCGLNRSIPYVSVTTGNGNFRVEFTWSAILRAVNEGEVLLG